MNRAVFSALDEYFSLYISHTSPVLWVSTIAFIVIVVIWLAVTVRRGKDVRRMFRYVLYLYLLLILLFTVVIREPANTREFNFVPFWSYHAPNDDLQASLLMENLLNVCLFIPLGFLFGCSYGKGIFVKAITFGLILSCGIEIIQYLSKTGFAEFDDVFHNTIGCLIGYVVFKINGLLKINR